MKRCPTCNRTYTDPNLVYCVEDGTPLSSEEPADESTVVSPYRPPSYVPPPTLHDKRRRVWPWLLGLLGAFGIGAIVLMLVAAVIAPRVKKSVERTTTTPTENTETPTTTENVDAPPPTDRDAVLAQLTRIEDEWTTANLAADKKKLEFILAEDYVGPSPDGGLMGKAEYLNTIERDTNIEKWEFYDMKLHLAGTRATLTGGITYFTTGQNITYNFIDRFVWRNGRWQATGSEIKRKDEQQNVNHN